MLRRTKRSAWIIAAIMLGAIVIFRGALVESRSSHVAVSTQELSAHTFYRVTRVVDGDTIDIDVRGEAVRLRLIGIDTPETVDPRRPVQCFGIEASAHAKVLLSGKSVRIETDLTQGRLDAYGRMLAYVFLSDGTFFNKEMIADGYAHEYTYRYPYKYQNEFREAQRQAREEGRGLWSSDICVK